MKHGDYRLHTGLQNSVNQIVVVVDRLLVDGCPGQDKWQNAGPRICETVVLDSHGCHTLNVLLV